jgi:hypothetical protein
MNSCKKITTIQGKRSSAETPDLARPNAALLQIISGDISSMAATTVPLEDIFPVSELSHFTFSIVCADAMGS